MNGKKRELKYTQKASESMHIKMSFLTKKISFPPLHTDPDFWLFSTICGGFQSAFVIVVKCLVVSLLCILLQNGWVVCYKMRRNSFQNAMLNRTNGFWLQIGHLS